MKVCVLGGINWDVAMLLRGLPEVGETVPALGVVEGAGGKGFNQAMAAARHGADVVLMGAVGDDWAGRELMKQARSAGVAAAAVVKPHAATGRAIILVDGAGRNMITVDAGANAALKAEDVDIETVRCCGVVVSQFEASLPALKTCFEAACETGAIRILNAAPALAEAKSLLDLASLIVLNEVELQRFAGMRDTPTEADDIVRAARTLVMTDRSVIVTRGAEGCILVTADEIVSVPGFEVDAIDTVGAGDCFCGTLAAELAEGQPLAGAIHRANAAAALSVQMQGAASSMPSRAALDAFWRAQGPAMDRDGTCPAFR